MASTVDTGNDAALASEKHTNVPDNLNHSATTSELKDESLLNSIATAHNSKRTGLELWYEFNERTTFHGYRYIFGREGNIFRRFVWLAFLITCTTLLVVQALGRIDYYHKEPVNVVYDVKYVRNMEFPAITVCNQNQLRLSSVYSDKRLHFLSKSKDNSYNQSDVTYESLYLLHAHQAKDLIVKCTWQGEKCDGLFKRTVLDYNVCYTFNGRDERSPIMTNRSGSGHALELVLNIEAYEYMPPSGFNIGSGIKLEIHDRNVYPSLVESGLFFSPGKLAIISLEKKVVNNLASKCEEDGLRYFDYSYTVDACRMECNIDVIMTECKCALPHMLHIYSEEELPECQLLKHRHCLANISGTINNDNCICPSPCQEIIFEPSMSYASLSDYAITDERDTELYKKSLYKSNAIRNIVKGKRDNIDHMKRLLDNTLSNTKQLEEALDNYANKSRSQVTNIRMYCNVTESESLSKKEEVKNLYNLAVSPEDIKRNLSIVDFRDNIILLLNILSNENVSSSVYYDIAVNAIINRKYLVNNVSEASLRFLNCCLSLGICDVNISSSLESIKDMESHLDHIMEITTAIYLATNTFDMTLAVHHLYCFEQSSYAFTSQYVSGYDCINKIYEKRASEHSGIKEACAGVKNTASEIEFGVKETLRYRTKMNGIVQPEMNMLVSLVDQLKSQRTSGNQSEKSVQIILASVLYVIQIRLEEAIYATQYLSLNTRFWNKMHLYVTGLNETDTNFKFLDIDNLVKDLTDTVMLRYQEMKKAIISMNERIVDVKELSTFNLDFYRRNFMHLSLSMKDMSFTTVTKLEAYDFIALISDLGGLMGLFIGGSVVSILELTDFMVDVCYVLAKRRMRKLD